jgi:hypothetical protein
MKYIFPVSASGALAWDKPLVDCGSDFDERPPTEEEIRFLKAQAVREELIEIDDARIYG